MHSAYSYGSGKFTYRYECVHIYIYMKENEANMANGKIF